ncbi:hypothetical protein [Mycolicibacterium sp. 050158]|uniref:hypothetical protein n=1 Tax=Mycolicibacterium sp. 050158 TaxID=3090602 RepID=UPI00299D219C|nr:hypothetical protein [Mycolicibacterium sp. 050158]MDX1887978.1 hypothetical protein [Mycolicibacterium sp. 050158]
MKTKFLAALVIACAGLFAGLFAGVAAPASASCAPGFTSIPCTIVTNVAQAPATTVGSLQAAPGQFLGQTCDQPTNGNPSANASSCGLLSITNLNGTGCPPNSDGSSSEPCGLTAAPGQLGSAIVAAPGQLAGSLAAAPAQLAGGLLSAPGTLFNSLTHGGTYTPDPAPTAP